MQRAMPWGSLCDPTNGVQAMSYFNLIQNYSVDNNGCIKTLVDRKYNSQPPKGGMEVRAPLELGHCRLAFWWPCRPFSKLVTASGYWHRTQWPSSQSGVPQVLHLDPFFKTMILFKCNVILLDITLVNTCEKFQSTKCYQFLNKNYWMQCVCCCLRTLHSQSK